MSKIKNIIKNEKKEIPLFEKRINGLFLMDKVNYEGINIMKDIPKELWDDTEFILKAIPRSLLSLIFINEDKVMVPEIIEKIEETVLSGRNFYDINNKDIPSVIKNHFFNSKKWMSIAIKTQANYYNLASDELKNDIDFIKLAMERGVDHKSVFNFINKALIKEEKLLEILNEFPVFFDKPSAVLKKVEVSTDLIIQEWSNLNKVVKNYYWKKIPIELLSDEHILEYLRELNSSKVYDKKLINIFKEKPSRIFNKEVLIEFAKHNYTKLPEKLKKDIELTYAGVSSSEFDYANIPQMFKNDKELCLKAINSSIVTWEDLTIELKKDLEVALLLTYKNKAKHMDIIEVLKYFPNNETLLEMILEYKNTFIKFLDPEITSQRKVVVEKIIRDNEMYKYIENPMRSSLQFHIDLVKGGASLIMEMDIRFVANETILTHVFSHSPKKVKDVYIRLRDAKELNDPKNKEIIKLMEPYFKDCKGDFAYSDYVIFMKLIEQYREEDLRKKMSLIDQEAIATKAKKKI